MVVCNYYFGGITMLGLFNRAHPELATGLTDESDQEVVEPQELPEYDHSLFEQEGEEVNDD